MAWTINAYTKEIHVTPDGDLAPHTHDMQCPCHPVEDTLESKVKIHNAFDKREAYEADYRGIRRKPH